MNVSERDGSVNLNKIVVLSVELLQFNKKLNSASEENRETFRHAVLEVLSERLNPLGGMLESCRKDIAFIAFHPSDNFIQTLESTLHFSLGLINSPLTLLQKPIRVKVGIALDLVGNRNGLTAVSERMVAQSGQVVVSTDIYELFKDDWQFNKIGPLKVGNNLVPFYQAVLPKYQRQPEQTTSIKEKPTDTKPRPVTIKPETPTLETRSEPKVNVSAKEAQAIAEKLMNPVSEVALAQADSSVANVLNTNPSELTSGLPSGLPSNLTSNLSAELSLSAGMSSMGGLSMPELPPLEELSEPLEKAIDPKNLVDESLMVASGYAPPLLSGLEEPAKPNIRYSALVRELVTELQEWAENPEGEGATLGKVVTLSAPDGVGKSFISNNLLLQSLIPDPRQPSLVWLSGHNFSCFHQLQVPLFLWIEIFHNLLPIILEGAPAQDIDGWLTQTLSQMDFGEQSEAHYDLALDFFQDFLSVTEPSEAALGFFQQKSVLAKYIRLFIHKMAEKLPVMLVIDDLDCADVASLDVLNQLLKEGLLEEPVCLLLTYKSGFQFKGELESNLAMLPVSDYRLDNLDNEDIEEFFKSGPLLGVWQSLNQQQKTALITNANGKTFYLFEAMTWLQSQGLLESNEQSGLLCLSHQAIENGFEFPVNLNAILENRLSTMSDRALYVLQVASVLGERFTLQLLIDICQYELEEMKTLLEQLVMQQFLITDFNQTAQFRHAQIWSLVYENTEPTLKQQLHGAIASYLIELKKNQFTLNPAFQAYHAQRANQPEQAYNSLIQTGLYNAQVGCFTGANMVLGQALQYSGRSFQSEAGETFGTESLPHAELQTKIAMINLQQRPKISVGLLEKALGYFNQTKDNARMIELLSYKASAHEHNGQITEALTDIQTAQSLVNDVQNPLELATLKMTEIGCFYQLGRLSLVRQVFDEAIEPKASHFKTLWKQPDTEFYFDAYLNVCSLDVATRLAQCDNQSLSRLDESLTLAKHRQISELVIPLTLTQIKSLVTVKPHYQRAKDLLHHILPTIEQSQSPKLLGQWGLVAMDYHIAIGELKSANDLLAHSLEQSEAANDHYTWILLNIQAGRIALIEKRYDDVAYILESMATESAEKRLATPALQCWRYLAEAFMGQGNSPQALDIATNALAVAQKPENAQILEGFELSLTQAAIQLDSQNGALIKSAGQQLQTLWPKIKATGYQPLIAKNAEAIGYLYQTLANSTAKEAKATDYQKKATQFYGLAIQQWQQVQNPYQEQQVRQRARQATSVA